jgi:hypothetical protein
LDALKQNGQAISTIYYATMRHLYQTKPCPHCGSLMVLALPPGGKGLRSLHCFECDRPDPLKTDTASGWLQGELKPPQ